MSLFAVGAVPAVPVSKIPPAIAKKFCNSLKETNVLAYQRLRQLYERYKLVQKYNPKPFEQFVTDLVCDQSIDSLIIDSLDGKLSEQNVPEFSCECIVLFNQRKARRDLTLATQRIEEMLSDPLCSFDIFHKYALLAFYNASMHIDALLAQSLRVAAYLRVSDAADQPVADASDQPIADAAALAVASPILVSYPF
jgi:hypothetical protein